MSSRTIADHLIAALAEHGLTGELVHARDTYAHGIVAECSVIAVPTPAGTLTISGATHHGADAEDYMPTYDADYPAHAHGAYLAEHSYLTGWWEEVYCSEGERLDIVADTAALMAAVTAYVATQKPYEGR
ncbi:hypothetical protein [Streptomyces virginiae]|uniref:hypothetical protein n=1 Tax=Streptomyces virginiae TaxID=1961 RepID=UPI002258BDDF|nr:hypothetical protein [Streptomyces virginiae]MCX5174256.1 hypothetical protein [Streptomyces virginiae]